MEEYYVNDYEELEKNHWWWQARRTIISSILSRNKLNSQPKPTLLDIGCGPGITIKHLQADYDCIGLEPNQTLVNQARKNNQVKIYQGSLPNNIPNFEQKFDYILMLDVIEHIKDDLSSLKAMQSLLNPGGKIIMTVPALPWMWSTHDDLNQHYRRYTKKSLQNLINQTTLNTVQIKYFAFLLLPPAFIIRRIFGRRDKQKTHAVTAPSTPANKILEKIMLADFYLTDKIPAPLGLSLLAVIENK